MHTKLACLIVACAVISTGCVVHHRETRHFRSKGENPNYYRLQITSNAFMTGAKYSSGFYNETALDTFLNETGAKEISTPCKSNCNDPEKPKDENAPKNTGAQFATIDSKGVYAYIFSTDAKAIADTIGSLAEGQVAADYINALVNKDRIKALDETRNQLEIKTDKSKIISVKSELEALVTEMGNKPPAAGELDPYVNVLNAIGRALGAPKFSGMSDASVYFNTLSNDQ